MLPIPFIAKKLDDLAFVSLPILIPSAMTLLQMKIDFKSVKSITLITGRTQWSNQVIKSNLISQSLSSMFRWHNGQFWCPRAQKMKWVFLQRNFWWIFLAVQDTLVKKYLGTLSHKSIKINPVRVIVLYSFDTEDKFSVSWASRISKTHLFMAVSQEKNQRSFCNSWVSWKIFLTVSLKKKLRWL